jgi:hypothetical protein
MPLAIRIPSSEELGISLHGAPDEHKIPFLNQLYFIVSYKYFPLIPYLQLQNSLGYTFTHHSASFYKLHEN